MAARPYGRLGCIEINCCKNKYCIEQDDVVAVIRLMDAIMENWELT